jgi:prevent-host-death family protein
MSRVKPSEDIRPLSEFRAKMAAFIDQVRNTGRPVVLTERGRSAAVLMGVTEYEDLMEELELLRDVRTAERQLAKGRGVPHGRAKAELKRRLRK